MANFNTHISTATVLTGMMATVSLKLGHVTESEAVVLTALGIIGGILPDIDLKYSYPSRILFSFLGLITSFITVFALQEQFSIMELWMTAVGVFLLIRFPVWMLFHHYTTHRGAIHSISTAILCGLTVTSVSHLIFEKTELLAWLNGLFLFSGFVLHLILDELYSVDFVGNKLKRSFGSALKLLDWDEWISSSIIIGLSVAIWLATPEFNALAVLTEQETYDVFISEFFPDDGWFGTQLEK